jgi:hypothetical protein
MGARLSGNSWSALGPFSNRQDAKIAKDATKGRCFALRERLQSIRHSFQE